jgi:hypothetical protein
VAEVRINQSACTPLDNLVNQPIEYDIIELEEEEEEEVQEQA